MRTALLCSALLLASPLVAASGHLDPRFDGDGIAVYEASLGNGSFDRFNAGLIDRAGRYVGAGSADGNADGEGNVMRVFPNGAIDTGFGEGGIVRVPLLEGYGLVTWVSIAEQLDGKLVLAGKAANGPGGNDPGHAYVCRLMPNGALDASFGDGGCTQPEFWFSSEIDNVAGMVLQADERIVLVGTADVEADGLPYEYVVARLETDGSFDPCFGDINCMTGGLLLAPEPPSDLPAFVPYAVAMAPDGRIVIAGNASGPQNKDMAVIRLLPSGLVDVGGFGNGGHRRVAFDLGLTNFDEARTVVVRSDGSIVIAGIITTPTGSLTGVAALDVTGTLINDFGTGGRVQLFFDDVSPIQTATEMQVQADGKLLIAGFTDDPNDGFDPSDCGIARLMPDGELDPLFANSGRLAIDGGLGLEDLRPDSCLGLDHDGRSIVLFGWRRPGAVSDQDSMMIRIEQDDLFRDGFEAAP
jgi:uncharacterized delta-60 repeat protein